MSMSIPQAAAHLGVSVKTVRRKLAAGQIKGEKRPTPQGYEWVIHLDQPSGNPGALPPPPVDGLLLRLLEEERAERLRLQRENFELAGRLGYFQAQLEHSREKILLLEAGPKRRWWGW